jgi:hypothetical protein
MKVDKTALRFVAGMVFFCHQAAFIQIKGNIQ